MRTEPKRPLLVLAVAAGVLLSVAGAARSADRGYRPLRLWVMVSATQHTDWSTPRRESGDCWIRSWTQSSGSEHVASGTSWIRAVAIPGPGGGTPVVKAGSWELIDLHSAPNVSFGVNDRAAVVQNNSEPGPCGGTPPPVADRRLDCGHRRRHYRWNLDFPTARTVEVSFAGPVSTPDTPSLPFATCPVLLPAEAMQDGIATIAVPFRAARLFHSRGPWVTRGSRTFTYSVTKATVTLRVAFKLAGSGRRARGRAVQRPRSPVAKASSER